jgi:hypothetical protein
MEGRPALRRSNEETSLRYRLATTAVTFSGTRTIRPGRRPTFEAEAALVVRADLVAPAFTLTVHDGIFHDTRTSLTFSDDGRLTSSSLDSSGSGAALLGSIVTTIAAVAGGAARRTLTAEAEGEGGGDDARPPDLADRYRAAEQSLLQGVAATASALPAARTADAVKAAEARLAALRTALDEVRRELAAMEPPPRALPPGRKVQYSFVLDVDDLPSEADLLDPDKRRSPDLAWARVVRRLGIMATVEDPPAAVTGPTLDDAARDPDPTKIWFRRPRRAEITVWGRINDGRLMRRQVVPVDVVDRHSEHDSLPMKERGWLNSTSVAVTLGPLGTPREITTTADSETGALARALGGRPTDVSGAVSAGAVPASGPAPASAADARIAALTAQKQQLQLRKDIADLRRATAPG